MSFIFYAPIIRKFKFKLYLVKLQQKNYYNSLCKLVKTPFSTLPRLSPSKEMVTYFRKYSVRITVPLQDLDPSRSEIQTSQPAYQNSQIYIKSTTFHCYNPSVSSPGFESWWLTSYFGLRDSGHVSVTSKGRLRHVADIRTKRARTASQLSGDTKCILVTL